MSIPSETTVLVIGGGPGGSYAAAVLAREGINTVLLEAEVFPRYHVGESMVASFRHFLRFIDLASTFDNHGFVKKTGAAFKLNAQKAAYTDFIVTAGPDATAWNVIRSESDHLFLKHAAKSGAKVFEGVKVNGIEFKSLDGEHEPDEPSSGRPVSATWVRKDGSSGQIKFDYLVDASGKFGIVSTKYLKNRVFNMDLKNVASWGYFKGAIQYGIGTSQVGQPYFEALHDGSGWAWFIPLHNGTVSVGVVMNQAMSTEKKRAAAAENSREFYLQSIQEALGISHLLANAELVTDVKHASDWSYSATKYASPFLRIVGDAGSFIDPYFSSGVHLALSGALSAALTISASIRGDCDEEIASKWHSDQVNDRFSRFLLVVLAATKQIRLKDTPILNNAGEDDFDEAFSIIRPIIQGTADVSDVRVDQDDVVKAVDFVYNAVQNSNGNGTGTDGQATAESITGPVATIEREDYSKDESRIMKVISNVFGDFFTVNVYYGMRANLERGKLGLVKDTATANGDKKEPIVATVPVQEEVAV